MTKHDEIRQILHEGGFQFKDSDRTALDMSDEEVEKFVFEFVSRMTHLGLQVTKAFQSLAVMITQAVEPLQDLGRILEEGGEEE